MLECADRVQARWRAGEKRDVHEEMTRLTLAIIGRTLFAADVEAEAAEVGAALTDAMESLQRFMLPFYGTLERLPLPGPRRVRASRRRLDLTIYRLLAARRATPGGGDLLSLLLETRDEHGQPMPDTQVRDEAMTIFLAGHETTAVTLTWTWMLLARHPAVERRLHSELDEVLGARPPTVDDLPGRSHGLRDFRGRRKRGPRRLEARRPSSTLSNQASRRPLSHFPQTATRAQRTYGGRWAGRRVA
jgi:cytochrome P450